MREKDGEKGNIAESHQMNLLQNEAVDEENKHEVEEEENQ